MDQLVMDHHLVLTRQLAVVVAVQINQIQEPLVDLAVVMLMQQLVLVVQEQ